MSNSGSRSWISVRCIFKATDPSAYEERITLWLADSTQSAIRMAEVEAAQYADQVGFEYVGLAQAYDLKSELVGSASEVFSLIRKSDLSPPDYIDQFFDTGEEFQQRGD
jgi:hypothetical protein